MSQPSRTLSPAEIEALNYWPGVVQAVVPEPVDLTVLVHLCNELLGELPWWNPAWQVTALAPAWPYEVARDVPWADTRFTEVSVPGTATGDTGATLPFSGQVRFTGNRLIRFSAKIGDRVIAPASVAAGRSEPHPFSIVFSRLMDARGISVDQMARKCYRSHSTIKMLRAGILNPHLKLVAEIAEAMNMSTEDLIIIAGLETQPVEHQRL